MTLKPRPAKPWYWPCRSCGARPICRPHWPPEPIISPTTWTSEPTTSTAMAKVASPRSARDTIAKPAAIQTAPRTRARAPASTESARRERRTWKSATQAVLMISRTATITGGAAVRWEM